MRSLTGIVSRRHVWSRLLAFAVAFAAIGAGTPNSSAADPTIPSFAATVASFDGTKIAVNFFPAEGLKVGQRAPTILQAPGFGNPATTDATAPWDPFAPNLVVGPGPLRAAGYNVVTWDPRGFGNSGGKVELDSPAYEGRDVSAIIDWVARQPEAQLQEDGVPRIGMDGGSYGGGIQLVAASIDPRIRAIVPAIAWNSLVTSLYPEKTFKSGFAPLLYALGALHGNYDSWITTALLSGAATGTVDGDSLAHLEATVPDISRITAPTLLIQGTVDTLFPLDQADTTARELLTHHVPTKVMWVCGGHGSCLTSQPGGDGQLIKQRTIQWLDKYVKGDTAIDTGPQFEGVDQSGAWFSAPTYPVPTGAAIVASSGKATLLLTAIGGSGPQTKAGELAATAGARADNAINLTVQAPPSGETKIVGAPQVTFTYSGTAPDPDGRVYAQLVDDTTGLVLGNQIMPIPVILDGQPHTLTHDLEPVAQTVRPGDTLTLQLTASTPAFRAAQPPIGLLQVDDLTVSLPTLGRAPGEPSACTAKRVVIVHLPRTARAASITVAGHRVETRGKPGHLRARVVLAHYPTRSVRVRIVYRTESGRIDRQVRTYMRCSY